MRCAGGIPESLGGLTQLETLNLSYNQLTGARPVLHSTFLLFLFLPVFLYYRLPAPLPRSPPVRRRVDPRLPGLPHGAEGAQPIRQQTIR